VDAAEATPRADPSPIPTGSLLRQDTDDTPIFRFEKTDTWGVTIERLGFTWKNQQGPPPNWPGIIDDPEESGKESAGPPYLDP
jgi:hypothetical protein